VIPPPEPVTYVGAGAPTGAALPADSRPVRPPHAGDTYTEFETATAAGVGLLTVKAIWTFDGLVWARVLPHPATVHATIVLRRWDATVTVTTGNTDLVDVDWGDGTAVTAGVASGQSVRHTYATQTVSRSVNVVTTAHDIVDASLKSSETHALLVDVEPVLVSIGTGHFNLDYEGALTVKGDQPGTTWEMEWRRAGSGAASGASAKLVHNAVGSLTWHVADNTGNSPAMEGRVRGTNVVWGTAPWSAWTAFNRG